MAKKETMVGGGVTPGEIPDATALQHVQETWVSGDGTNKTVFVSITEGDMNKLKLSIGGDGSQTVSQLIDRDDVYTESVFDVSAVGFKEPFVAERNTPFVIFSQTERNTPSPNGTARGVIVWLVPVEEGG